VKICFAEIEPLLNRYLRDDAASGVETIHTRSGERGGLLRLFLSGGSVVVKFWRIRNIKERFKAVTHISNGRREWRMHRLIHRAGVKVAEPLFFSRFFMPGLGPCEIMAIEDVGEVESGVAYLKRLITTGLDSEITSFEDRMIDTTIELLELKILDMDNQLNNFLIDSTGRVIRVDFECARRPCCFALRRRKYATMLERLLRSHLHAAYPEIERTKRFMARVATRLSVPTDIRQMVIDISAKELTKENKQSGIGYASNLEW